MRKRFDKTVDRAMRSHMVAYQNRSFARQCAPVRLVVLESTKRKGVVARSALQNRRSGLPLRAFADPASFAFVLSRTCAGDAA